MPLYSITNVAKGARGVGAFLVEAGESVAVELTEDESLLLGELDGVTIAEVKPEKAAAKDAK